MSTTTRKRVSATAHDGKGFLELAGEALSVLGTDIVEGKDKVVEVATEKITVFKRAVGNIIHKKNAGRSSGTKAAAGKKAKSPVRTAAKKSQPKKRAGAQPKERAQKVVGKAPRKKK